MNHWPVVAKEQGSTCLEFLATEDYPAVGRRSESRLPVGVSQRERERTVPGFGVLFIGCNALSSKHPPSEFPRSFAGEQRDEARGGEQGFLFRLPPAAVVRGEARVRG